MHRRLPILVMAACLLVGIVSESNILGEETTDAPTADPTLRDNCGVKATYVTLRLFGKIVPLQDFGAMTNAGRTFERDCSIADIKRALESQGLAVRALKVAKIGAMLPYAAPRSVLIVRIQGESGGVKIAHFGVIVGVNGGVVLIDSPAVPRIVSAGKIEVDGWFALATGEFLDVTEPAPAGPPTLILRNPQIDLGTIRLTEDIPHAIVNLANGGGSPLKITKVQGPCSCFSGASGDMELAPGRTGAIQLAFDKTKLPVGPVQRSVVLETNDPAHAQIEVTVKMVIEALPAPREARVAPEIIAYGRTTSTALSQRHITIRITVPAEDREAPSKIEWIGSDGAIHLEPNGNETVEDADGTLAHILTYDLAWMKSPPPGALHSELQFIVKRSSMPDAVLRVPIGGEVLEATP